MRLTPCLKISDSPNVPPGKPTKGHQLPKTMAKTQKKQGKQPNKGTNSKDGPPTWQGGCRGVADPRLLLGSAGSSSLEPSLITPGSPSWHVVQQGSLPCWVLSFFFGVGGGGWGGCIFWWGWQRKPPHFGEKPARVPAC